MSPPAPCLAGRTALVTGSGRGLGRAIATRLAQLGANLVVHDQTEHAPAEFGEAKNLGEVAEQIAALGVQAVPLVADIADEAAVHGLVESARARLGPVDVLVNCAGGDIAARGGKPQPNDGLGVPLDDVRAILDRNLIGTWLVCRAVCPQMAERKTGSVVNVASLAAHRGVTNGVAYAVAKAGIVQLSRCLCEELRPHGVRVNVVSPGPTMTARFLATRTTDPQQRDTSVPLDRYGQPAEVADAVAFLCGDDSRFVSGQVLCVDGGRSAFST